MHHDLVIINEPTDNVKNLPKNILSYLYKKVNVVYNLEDGHIKIVDINHDIINNELEISFNILLISPQGMVIRHSISYNEYNIKLRREKILKIQGNE